MKRAMLVAAVMMSWLLAGAVRGDDDLLKGVPAETLKLYDRYRAEYVQPNKSDPTLVTDLEAAPGGDVCFLDRAMQKTGDWPRITARAEVTKLKTERTYELLTGELDSADEVRRTYAIELLGEFHRGANVTKFLAILAGDASEYPRDAAARVLGGYDDPRVEAALLAALKNPVPMVVGHAFDSLAWMKSKAAFPLLVARLGGSKDSERESVITDIATYHDKAAVKVLLEEFQRQQKDTGPYASRLAEWTHARLRDCLREAKGDLGALPDQRYEEWADYWARAEPLLTEDLKLKEKPVAAVAATYRAEDFARTADAVKLTASVGAAEIRTGDPIRLELTMVNEGKQPASVVMPRVPSGWMPTMAYGIRLKRDGAVLLDVAASDFYEGSYSGPPGFETLGPGAKYQSAVCLQYWLGALVEWPLKEGAYEMTITFDPAKYAGMKAATGVQLLGRWEAPAVKFAVKGAARTDAEDVMRAIGALTGQKFLLEDLTSDTYERHEAAWRTLMEYGDSRLAPLLRKIETEEPTKGFAYLKAEGLRAYEMKARPVVRP